MGNAEGSETSSPMNMRPWLLAEELPTGMDMPTMVRYTVVLLPSLLMYVDGLKLWSMATVRVVSYLNRYVALYTCRWPGRQRDWWQGREQRNCNCSTVPAPCPLTVLTESPDSCMPPASSTALWLGSSVKQGDRTNAAGLTGQDLDMLWSTALPSTFTAAHKAADGKAGAALGLCSASRQSPPNQHPRSHKQRKPHRSLAHWSTAPGVSTRR